MQNKYHRTVLSMAFAFMGFTLLPYLFGWSIAGNRTYTAFHYNTDDFCVYTAWTTQAKQGHFFFDNRFTTDDQPRKTVHLFFWLLGTLERLTHLPIQFIFHASRFIFGILFIMSLFSLAKKVFSSEKNATLSVVVTLLASGLGWALWPPDGLGWNAPADAWQPELITFTMLYFNPLFAVSAWLMLCTINAVLEAEHSPAPVLKGMAAAFLLGNIHTYDLATLCAVVLGFTLVKIVCKQFNGKWFFRSILIGSGGIPPILWFLYVHHIDPVFQSRAATLTFSEPIWKYILGFGLLLPLALVAVYVMIGQARKKCDNPLFTGTGAMLLPAWAIIGFAIPYLPVLFQRKLWMGEHIPIALLATGGIIALLQYKPILKRYQTPLLVGITLLLSLTNIRWIVRDMGFLIENKSNTGIHTPYLYPEQWEAIEWLKQQTEPDDAVLTYFNFGCYISAFSGNKTWVSHWSETPNFNERVKLFFELLSPDVNIERKKGIIKQTRCRYLISNAEESQANTYDGDDWSYAGKLVFQNAYCRIWQVED